MAEQVSPEGVFDHDFEDEVVEDELAADQELPFIEVPGAPQVDPDLLDPPEPHPEMSLEQYLYRVLRFYGAHHFSCQITKENPCTCGWAQVEDMLF